MTEKQLHVCKKVKQLKQLGFTQGSRVKLYGEVFDLAGEPIAMADNLVFVDATDKKSGRSRRFCEHVQRHEALEYSPICLADLEKCSVFPMLAGTFASWRHTKRLLA